MMAVAKALGIELDASKLEMVEATTEDGSILRATAWEAGEAITIEVDGEEVPLTVGEYVIDGVGIIVVEQEGVIAQVKPFDSVEEEMKKEEPKKEEPKKEDLDDEKPMTKKDFKEMVAKLSEQKSQVSTEKKKVALAKVIKMSPEGNGSQSTPSRFKFSGRGMQDYKQRIYDALYGEDAPRANVKLSTTTSITTTYAGQFAGDYIAAALLTPKTIADGGLTIHANIALKMVLKKMAVATIIKNATCDFDPTGTVTLTEALLTPEEFQVNLDLCKKDFWADWESEKMGYSAYKNLPPTFAEYFIAHILAMAAEKNG